MREEIKNIIIQVLEEFKDQREIDIRGDLDYNTPLFGKEAQFDSIGIVMFMVAVEQAIEEKLGFRISLSDENAMIYDPSPYKNVSSLVDYADQAIKIRILQQK